MPKDDMLSLVTRVFRHAAPARRRQLRLTIALMAVGAAAEVATIGAVLTFLALVGQHEAGSAATGLLAGVGARLGLSVLGLATLLLIGVALAGGVVRMALAKQGQKLAFDVGHDLSTKIYAQLLHQPYAWHLEHNSGHLIVAVNQVQTIVFAGLLPAIQALTALILAAFIILGLLLVDPVIALICAGAMGIAFAGISLVTRRRLVANSKVIARGQNARMLILREGLGGIRDVVLGASQPVFARLFDAEEARIRDRWADNQFLLTAPRFAIEAIVLILLALVGLFVGGRTGGLAAAMPVLGALAVGGSRLLPLIQQVQGGIASVTAHAALFVNVLRLLDDVPPAPHAPAVLPPFRDRLTVEGAAYRYPTATADTLQRIDLDLPKGHWLGLVGPTGGGKTTLADLLMGLLLPTQGRISVDGTPLEPATMAAWQAQIAHVPQSILLADATIAANIAFGLDTSGIDMGRVRSAARAAQLDRFIDTLANGYDTVVGEDGVRLSGGQRQRIGIARALYGGWQRGSQVLVLDEATSALDEETEAAVMAAIRDLAGDWTVVIISHRPSALACCNAVLRIEDGRIVARDGSATIGMRDIASS